MPYRGRLAPSPTGYLHLGHAMTFWRAQERCRRRGGQLVLRIEDLDPTRCRPEFRAAIVEDLRWFELEWEEGPDVGGPFGPYVQSERRELHLTAWENLRAAGFIYPCTCSRRDVLEAAGAPHEEDDEPIYPGTCRALNDQRREAQRAGVNWRFRVPEREALRFVDGNFGEQSATTGTEFGDFLIWRKDDVPAYQLAVVVDDAAMEITEVVRGADLLRSTFRQLLLYRALGFAPPEFYHAPLVRDADGQRLAKRDAAVALRGLRARGFAPVDLRTHIAAT
ncbi:MAG: tRNA glutamyl-Q(34) synthetase GluQRS [Chthoniobacterales bacterium]